MCANSILFFSFLNERDLFYLCLREIRDIQREVEKLIKREKNRNRDRKIKKREIKRTKENEKKREEKKTEVMRV